MEETSGYQSTYGVQPAVGPWRLGRLLGEGASGRVCLGKHQKTGKFAAVKIISKDKAQGTTTSIQEAGYDIQQAVEREIVVMNIPAHPNMIQLYEIWESRDEIYLVLEYVSGGDLLQYMTRRRFLPEKEVAHLFKQLLNGLSHIHKFSIYHRDLKHENLMMDQSGNVKIGDFGMAALQPLGHKFTSSCGSPNYAAPEVVQNVPYDGSAADIWSSGIILFGMLTHRLPFDDPDTSTILNRIVCADYKLPKSISSEAADLIIRMLELDPAKRITLDRIFDHPFLKKHRVQLQDRTRQTNESSARQNLSVFAKTVDMDIVSKLRALWMAQDETSLANKVIFQEMSQERLFYNLLIERHFGEQCTDVPNDIVLKPNTSTPRPDFDGLQFMSINRNVPFTYREKLHPLELAPKSTTAEQGWKNQSLKLGIKMTDGRNISMDKTRTSYKRQSAVRSRPLPPESPVKILRQDEVGDALQQLHAAYTASSRSHNQHAEAEQSDAKRRYGQIGAVRVCLKLLSRQNSYKRKVRKTQSRRSVIFTGNQAGMGIGGPRRPSGVRKYLDFVDGKLLYDLKQHIRKPVGTVAFTGTSKLLNITPKVGPEHATEEKSHEHVTQGGRGPPNHERKGSHGGRAPLVLLDTSSSKQTIFLHESITKSRKRLNAVFSVWQSYGAGRVRMTGSKILWNDATVARPGSGHPFVCTVQMTERDDGTALIVSRDHGSSARLKEIVAELIEYLSGCGIRKNDGEAGVRSFG